jgi:hypothetical protein
MKIGEGVQSRGALCVQRLDFEDTYNVDNPDKAEDHPIPYQQVLDYSLFACGADSPAGLGISSTEWVSVQGLEAIPQQRACHQT